MAKPLSCRLHRRLHNTLIVATLGVMNAFAPAHAARMTHAAATADGVAPLPLNQHGLRRFPYPFQAMLAVASDCDGMTPRKFTLIHRFLNTHSSTVLGPGLGLDIADSLFFFVGTDRLGWCDYDFTAWQDQMSWFHRLADGRPHHADLLLRYIRAGWIDSLHSYGDFSMQDETATRYARRFALAASNALHSAGVSPTVWINHGNRSNVGNFGNPESTYQQGDVPNSPYYCADVAIAAGIRFVWTRRDSQFGLASMLYPITLRDGQKIWGFYRYTDDGYTDKGQLRWNWNPRMLSAQLSDAHLSELERRHEFSIVAQHLGGDIAPIPFYGANLDALTRLKREQDAGRLIVARTSRLLRYNEVTQYLRFRRVTRGKMLYITIGRVQDPILGAFWPTLDDLRGVTFYTARAGHTVLLLRGVRIPSAMVQTSPPDDTGAPSIGIKWWPADTTDYTRGVEAPSTRSRHPSEGRGATRPAPAGRRPHGQKLSTWFEDRT